MVVYLANAILVSNNTVGTSFHIKANFIPTVERVNIDFHTPCIQMWNKELLEVAGVMARVYYDAEIARYLGLQISIIVPSYYSAVLFSVLILYLFGFVLI